MLAVCETAEDVRRLASRQAEWRRQMFAPRPEPVVIEPPVPEPVTPANPIIPIVTAPPFLPWVTITQIQYIVCARFNISRIELLAERRTAAIVRPRHIAMWLAKKLTTRSLPQIGRQFGGRDHTTVLHATRKIDAERAINAELAQLLDELEAELLA